MSAGIRRALIIYDFLISCTYLHGIRLFWYFKLLYLEFRNWLFLIRGRFIYELLAHFDVNLLILQKSFGFLNRYFFGLAEVSEKGLNEHFAYILHAWVHLTFCVHVLKLLAF